ncbi:MAG: hypothetical protein HUJ25_09760 [Crocinitomicaceae bacterium]|nr:hypothetical protein [Crocinitomicaceae bacterium]
MKCFALLVTFLLTFTIGYGQTNIKTPFGFKKLYIEMSSDDLEDEMGKPQEIRSFEDEKKVWVNGGFDLKKAIVYHIGFDQVYIYDYQNKYCLWKAYIKEGKVVYMNLTGRWVKDEYVNNVTIRNELHFYDRIEKFEEVLGKNFFPDRNFGYTDYLYHDLGIRFTFKQSKMTNIYLFRRFTNMADLYKYARYYPKDKP